MDNGDVFLCGHNEPCIVDGTPQFAETAGVITSCKSRAPSIRANVAQTALLKKAYEESNNLSSEQAKVLAEETRLPPKWILQWFGRQRSKERKNGINYKPRAKSSNLKDASTTASRQNPNPAAFSATFFSDPVSGASATGSVSAQEIMTIKSEHESSTPSLSGSTSVEEFTPSELHSEPDSAHLDMVAPEEIIIKFFGTGRKKTSTGRKNRKAAHRLEHASDPNAQIKSTDKGCFRLLKFSPGKTTYGLNPSDDAHSGMTEPNMDAYTQLSSPPISQCRAPTPSTPLMHLPRVVPPRRSPIVTSDNAIRSTIRETKTPHRPSRLSVVNLPMDESYVSHHQEDSFSVPIPTHNSAAEAFSLALAQYNNPLSIAGPQDRHSTMVAREAQMAEPVLYSQYLVPPAGTRLSKAEPPVAVASGFPDFVELDSVMDSFAETFRATFPSPFLQDRKLMCLGSAFAERYGRPTVIEAHPSTNATVRCYAPTLNLDHLEALDPSRAPLKHLRRILTEYEAEDGTYFSLLFGLQDPARRKKIIRCLSNEELVSHDPFAGTMGLALLSRLGVL